MFGEDQNTPQNTENAQENTATFTIKTLLVFVLFCALCTWVYSTGPGVKYKDKVRVKHGFYGEGIGTVYDHCFGVFYKVQFPYGTDMPTSLYWWWRLEKVPDQDLTKPKPRGRVKERRSRLKTA